MQHTLKYYLEYEYLELLLYRHTSLKDEYVYNAYIQSMSVLRLLEQMAAF